ISRILPVINTVKTYNVKAYMYSDIVAGLSVGFLHMPQGLAYGLLASLSPISGLYTSFFPVLLYIFFGTCPHISMGTNSVLSLITAAMVENQALVAGYGQSEKEPDPNATLPTAETLASDSEAAMNYKIRLAMTSAFYSGVILILMGLLRVGFVTSYMPSSFVGGFTTGASVHIATSQMKHVFHIKVKTHSGAGKLIKTYRDIFKEIHNTNYLDVIISITSIVVLLFFVVFANPRCKRRYGYEPPINLILVILFTFVSYVTDLNKKYGVNIVGHVPLGFPKPELPDFLAIGQIFGDTIVLTMIVFAMTISMAMLMAKIHGYDVDSNKELIAYGICNLGSSFFKCQVSSVSPPRTMILSNAGTKTVLNGVVTAAFLFCMFFAGTLLETLPIPYLAAMIMVAVKDLLLQCLTIFRIYVVSRTDFIVWVFTFLITVFADLHYGIVCGILLSVFGIIVNNQRVEGTLIAKADDENLLVQGENREGVSNIPGIRIFYFPSQLFFANAETFKKQLYGKVFDPTTVHDITYQLDDDPDNELMNLRNEEESIKCIIIDCSAMTYVDLDGFNMLKMVIVLYHQAGIQMLLVRVPARTMATFERGGLFSIIPRRCILHDVEDALHNEEDTRDGVSRLSIAPPSGFAQFSTARQSFASRLSSVL
ncbi:sulfate transporter-like, partial [Physella acuta]|uniref:sulfate transporter-like n=1 Tax=Physella acuta TaxID=109671 RepID=UPI0027DE3989